MIDPLNNMKISLHHIKFEKKDISHNKENFHISAIFSDTHPDKNDIKQLQMGLTAKQKSLQEIEDSKKRKQMKEEIARDKIILENKLSLKGNLDIEKARQIINSFKIEINGEDLEKVISIDPHNISNLLE